MDYLTPIVKSVCALQNMIREMNRKNIELKRITKTASLLRLSGVSANSIPFEITERCLQEQYPDGGWVSIVDTIWNAFYLKIMDPFHHAYAIDHALEFLQLNKTNEGLWGRSQRDISRIPVSGVLFFLFRSMANENQMESLEKLWKSEINSITYKAAYTLMAFQKAGYSPDSPCLIPNSVGWLIQNQKEDGGFSPWQGHPVDSDIYCTAISLLGLLQYKELVPVKVFEDGSNWIVNHQLPSGIWKYHEIEDGASWGLYALCQVLEKRVLRNG